jgi:hypothetical protein
MTATLIRLEGKGLLEVMRQDAVSNVLGNSQAPMDAILQRDWRKGRRNRVRKETV